jgi:hypothetical protein
MSEKLFTAMPVGMEQAMVCVFIDKYSKTCLKRNLKGPERFSAKASFCLIKVHCLKRNLKGPEQFLLKPG